MTERIKHIGPILSICGLNNRLDSIRDDLGYERYLRLGIKERFRDEELYRICKRCLRIIQAREAKAAMIDIQKGSSAFGIRTEEVEQQ